MAKATASKTASKPASKGKTTTTTTTASSLKSTPVARPAIGKDDMALKEDVEASKPAAVAGKKRKSTTAASTSSAKDPEHDPETIKNTENNSKSHSGAPKDASKITPGVATRSEDDHTGKPNKRAKVHVSKPAVTVEKTTDEVPLPTVASSSSTGPAAAASEKKGKKPVSSKKTQVESVEETAVAPSASKPASTLKSALKSKPKAKQPAATEEADFIHGFSSSDGEGDESEAEDDSDVDMDAAAGAGGAGEKKVLAGDLPKVVEGDKAVQEKLLKAKRRSGKEKGVLYLGRIPHGFYEEEMKAYFSQFGDISRLRLARNKKTGASKHFAYIEMPNKSVAEITAETMHNYLLMGHILQCHVVPADKIHPDIWIGANRKWRRVPSARLERSQFGKDRTEAQQSKTRSKLVNREKERKSKMKAAGIDYEYEGFTA